MNLYFQTVLSILIIFGIGNKFYTNIYNPINDVPVVQAFQTFDVLVSKDIVYGEALSHEHFNSDGAATIQLELDVYQPDNNSKNRPAFLFVHGGGFIGGSKEQAQIVHWANFFASRGWVFIAIDYRLKKDFGTVPDEWIDYVRNVPNEKASQFLAIYPAIRDSKAAIRWLVANAHTYNVNPEYITLGGGSAGAVSAIATGISNLEDFRDEIDFKQDPTLLSTHLNESYNIKTIINLWGSKTGLDILKTLYGHQRFDSKDPSMFIAHGVDDPTVPFQKAIEIKNIYNSYGLPLAFYPLEGYKHGAWNATVNGMRLERLVYEFIVTEQKLILH